MKGDFSRITFDRADHFTRVLMQQGRVQLDADWNEQAAILLHYMRTLASDLIGPLGAGPLGAGPAGDVGFEVTLADDELSVGPGRYYVGGLLCENRAETPIPGDLPEMPLLVYLDVWERHLTHLQQDGLREVALGGPDTATRAQIVWKVRVSSDVPVPGSAPSPAPESPEEQWSEWLKTHHPSERGALRARAIQPEDLGDPCTTSPDARYRGAENQLYRVEIHGEKSENNETSVLAFKWSRENGSVVFAIRDLHGRKVNLEDLGPDEIRSLQRGDWVEYVDDGQGLDDVPGPLLQVEEVDPDRFTVTLAAPKDGGPDLPAARGYHALLRRWDHRASREPEGGMAPRGAVLFEFTSEDEQPWLELEDGIQVQFGKGLYRSGDYWVIPARTATGDVEWPQEEPASDAAQGGPVPKALGPHGVDHFYAPLARVTDEKVEDLRRHIEPIGQPGAQ